MSRKKKQTPGDIIRYLVMIIAVGVFLFSAGQLIKIFLEYKAGTDEYDRVREYVRAAEEKPKKEEIEGQEEQIQQDKPKPPQIDWPSLQNLNKEIIGWIQIEGTEISYPVVKGKDNAYYLKHTFEKNANGAGAIFVDYMNSSNFQDCNTIIYGHNMRNGSMFGTLRKHFKDQASVPGKYIWICTPEKNYRYEIFSSHVVDASGEAYTLFSEPDEQFAAYVEKMVKQSGVDFGTAAGQDDKVITLSTCTGNTATRFIVQAKREGEY